MLKSRGASTHSLMSCLLWNSYFWPTIVFCARNKVVFREAFGRQEPDLLLSTGVGCPDLCTAALTKEATWGFVYLMCRKDISVCLYLFATSWTATCQASLSITNSQSLLKLMYITLLMPSNHLISCHPLLLPSILPSIRVFSNELVLCIR